MLVVTENCITNEPLVGNHPVPIFPVSICNGKFIVFGVAPTLVRYSLFGKDPPSGDTGGLKFSSLLVPIVVSNVDAEF